MAVPNDDFDYLPFSGGYDTETAGWEVRPGMLRDTLNYEIGIRSGYRDVKGYERFDGQPAPSDALFYTMNVEITGEFSVGDTITGATSTETAVVAAVIEESQDYLVITKVSGAFTLDEDLEVSASVEGTVAAVAVLSGGATPQLLAQNKNYAADIYRTDIAAVPGSGSILGVWWHNSKVYAVRNNAGSTAAVVHESSASGWVELDLGETLPFTSGGTYEVAEGDTITGATSTETATVERIVITSGTIAGGDAVGTYILSSVSGPFQAENLDVGGNLDVATIAADSTPITLSPGGRFETYRGDFTNGYRVYGCDGVNQGFEFDGSVWVPIDTGMAVDTPEHVAVHRNHLFFSFGGSLQHSGISTPYIWTPVLGATEIRTDTQITALHVVPGVQTDATLAVLNRNKSFMLYGTSSSDWRLIAYREEIGAIAYTVEEMASTVFMDDRGVRTLVSADNQGNFVDATLTEHIQTYINTKRSLAVASCIVRNKNQYRVFFSDGTALYLTFDGKKLVGAMPQELADAVTCIDSVEDSGGDEVIYFGSDNGMVYQMEKGTSFDGEPITANLAFHYHYAKSLGWIKKYFNAAIEAAGSGYASFSFSYELGYNSPENMQPVAVANPLLFAAPQWDSPSMIWDSFTWDGASITPARVKMGGKGENVGVLITKSSDYMEPVLMTGVRFRQVTRRKLR